MDQYELRNYVGYEVEATIVTDKEKNKIETYVGVLQYRYYYGNTMLFSIEGTSMYGALASQFKSIKINKS